MPFDETAALLQKHALPGRLRFERGQGGFPRAQVTTPWSTAEIYLHGAQVTAFQKSDEPPLLFLSERSVFAEGKAIRGGIPICFPWFGPRANDVAHGFARLTDWVVVETSVGPDGAVALRLELPDTPARRGWPLFAAELVVTVGQNLTLELVVSNLSADQDFDFEDCFHSYFQTGDIEQVSIGGLGAPGAPPLQIHGHHDQTYLDSAGPMEILDPVLGRRIRIEKSGSRSTVVWNPWTTQVLADLGSDEYRRMVCVESGNIGRNRIRLAPGQEATLSIELTTEPLSRD